MSNPQPPKDIPARYIGETPLILMPRPDRRPFLDTEGKPLPSVVNFYLTQTTQPVVIIEKGQELLWPEKEVLGETLMRLVVGGQVRQTWTLGAGKRYLPEHLDEQGNLKPNLPYTYEFMDGRSDFEPLAKPDASAAPVDGAPAEMADEVEIPAELTEPEPAPETAPPSDVTAPASLSPSPAGAADVADPDASA